MSRDAFDIAGAGRQTDRSVLARRTGARTRRPVPSEVAAKEIEEREGWGEASVRTASSGGVAARRRIALERFVYALGIRQVGQSNARLLARHYGSLDRLIAAAGTARDGESEAYEELTAIDGVGPGWRPTSSVFFAESRNRAAVEALAREVTVGDSAVATTVESPVAGKTVTFTGRLETMARAEAKAMAQAAGAKVTGSVSARPTTSSRRRCRFEAEEGAGASG